MVLIYEIHNLTIIVITYICHQTLSLCLRKRSKSKFERSHSAPWALSLLVVGVSLGPSFQIGLSS